MWEKILLVGSAVPIAVFCNIVRITATCVLYETAGTQWAKVVFHDLAGWLMMIMALGLLKLEMWMLAQLLIEPPPRAVVPVLPGHRTLNVLPQACDSPNESANEHRDATAERDLVTV